MHVNPPAVAAVASVAYSDEGSVSQPSAPTAALGSPNAPRITSELLTQVSDMYERLVQRHCEHQDALCILFDCLNTGSTEGYRAALSAADAAIAAATAAPAANRDFHPGDSMPLLPRPWYSRSWPEKILALKDGGIHATFRLGMNEDFFLRGKSLLHRGHAELPPGCVQFVALRAGMSDSAFSADLFRTQIDPVLRHLKPNQAVLLITPSYTVLTGLDMHGQPFALASGLRSEGASKLQEINRMLTGPAAQRVLALLREMVWQPLPWGILMPR